MPCPSLTALQNVSRRVGLASIGLFFSLMLWAGCTSSLEPASYVARVGNSLLTQGEVNALIQDRPVFLDSVDAVSQIVEQWVTNELLYQEALSRGLRGDPDVQRLLADNERSVLIDALVSRVLAAEMNDGPDESAIQTYYEQHREKLALREPFVRVRHLIYENQDSAEAARAGLQASLLSPVLPEGGRLASGLSDDAFYPERQMFAATPGLGEVVANLDIGDVHDVFEMDSTFHVVQLMDRLETGAVPSIDMVRREIRDRVAIDIRKQLYARQVERLRTRALAREELEVR
ncbi:MAG: peptidyl-prolyl cis-trans isomerase [Rhodothermales bacterium]